MDRSLQVLTVDDHEHVRELVSVGLDAASTSAGVSVQVSECVDGEFACAHVVEVGADLLITDVMMPRLTGPESMKRMIGAGGEVPHVVFMTGGGVSDSDRALLAELMEDPRFLGILSKPVNADSLEALLRIVSVRKGLLGAGHLPDADKSAVEKIHGMTREACATNYIPLAKRFKSSLGIDI